LENLNLILQSDTTRSFLADFCRSLTTMEGIKPNDDNATQRSRDKVAPTLG
jgi:hypothetical protein